MTPGRTTNVTVGPPSGDSPVWTASRVITLVFTIVEVLLLIRFVLKLLSANADQALVSLIYGVTDPIIAPFRGIFAQPSGAPVVEIATLLAIVFFVLLAALILAVVRAVTGRRGEQAP